MFFQGIFGIFAVFKNFYLFIPQYISKPLRKLRSVERYVNYLDSSAMKQHTSYLPSTDGGFVDFTNSTSHV